MLNKSSRVWAPWFGLGPAGIAKQRERGKLTVRERVAQLADPGSFQEAMALVGSATYAGTHLQSFVPKPQVEGTVRIDGRKVLVKASDFSVRGGLGRQRLGAGRGAVHQ